MEVAILILVVILVALVLNGIQYGTVEGFDDEED